MSFLIVGHPKLLSTSSSFLTTFLQFGLSDLPRSLSGRTSLAVGSPWMHLAAFHGSSPYTFLTPCTWSGLGACPCPRFFETPSKSDETPLKSSTVFLVITVLGKSSSYLSGFKALAAPSRTLFSPYPNLCSAGSNFQL